MTSGADHRLDVRAHNESAWDKQVDWENPWTIPVTTEAVERARRRDWDIVLTPTKPVPRTWFGNLPGLDRKPRRSIESSPKKAKPSCSPIPWKP